MHKAFLVLLITLLCIPLYQSKLIKVIQLNRHGARTASNYNEELLNDLYGEDKRLSNNGYRQHQILGQYARKKYIKDFSFLSAEFNSKEFEMYSTPTQRTVYSSDGFLSGLYPGYIIKTIYNEPTFALKSDDSIPIKDLPPIREIPLTVLSMKQFEMFDSFDCLFEGRRITEMSRDKSLYPNYLPISSKEMRQATFELAIHYHKEDELINTTPEKFMSQIGKLIFTDFYHYGKSFNHIFSPVTNDVIRKYGLNKWYNTKHKESQLSTIEISQFFEVLLAMLDEAVMMNDSGMVNGYRKYTVYSSHDAVIVNIISNLIEQSFLNNMIKRAVRDKDAFDFLVPVFSANLVFELHLDEKSNVYYVIVIYNGLVINYPLRKGLNTDHKGHIAYDLFKSLIEDRINPNWRLIDCSKVNPSHENNNNKTQPNSKMSSRVNLQKVHYYY